GGEHRPEQQSRAAELDGIVQPSRQLPQPVPDRLFSRRLGFLVSGEAQRVHVPEDGVLGPRRHPLTIAVAEPEYPGEPPTRPPPPPPRAASGRRCCSSTPSSTATAGRPERADVRGAAVP